MLELDALALEEEEEGPSYLADLNKVPDFVDEAPIEVGTVSLYITFAIACPSYSANLFFIRRRQDKKLSRQQARIVRLIVTSEPPISYHDVFPLYLRCEGRSGCSARHLRVPMRECVSVSSCFSGSHSFFKNLTKSNLRIEITRLIIV